MKNEHKDFINNNYKDFLGIFSEKKIYPALYLYLNPRNIDYILNRLSLDRTVYRTDGIYLTSLLNTIFPIEKGRNRQSFDFTSLANPFFKRLSRTDEKLFMAGGGIEEVRDFVDIVRDLYPGINIVGYCSGYEGFQKIEEKVENLSPNVIMLGLGNIKQEEYGNLLVDRFNIPVFTCGAFISQTARSKNGEYYPKWINKLELRWLFRFIKEPHTIVRVVKHYPMFFFKMIKIALSR